jgi:MFS family permease
MVYELGVLIYYYPVLSMLNEWFDKRRGRAYGILFGANGLSGVSLPYIIEKLLGKYGFATTLRCYAIGAVLLTLPALVFLRRRLPHNTTAPLKSQSLCAILKTVKFWTFAASSLLQGIAFSLPSIFLPTFAYSLSLPSYTGPLLLAIFNIFQAFSDLLLGYLSDKFSVSALVFSSSFLSGIVVLLFWGLSPLVSSPLTLLVFFAALYGGAAGGYSVLYPSMATALAADEADKRTLYGVWSFERGAGNVLGGLLSGVLVRGAVENNVFGAGKFRWLVAFTAGCLVVSAVAVAEGLISESGTKQKKTEDGEGV